MKPQYLKVTKKPCPKCREICESVKITWDTNKEEYGGHQCRNCGFNELLILEEVKLKSLF